MLEKQYQLLDNETLSQNFTTNPIPYGNEAGWILVARVNGAPSGTSPTLTWALLTSSDGVNYTQLGANLSSLTGVAAQVTPYITGSTQGAIPAGTLFFKVTGTLGGTNPVFPNVYADLVAFDQ